jgi:hypothetical protein
MSARILPFPEPSRASVPPSREAVVVRVEFGRPGQRKLRQLERKLQALSDLPNPDHYAIGFVTVAFDGEFFHVIQRVAEGDGWRRLATYDQDTLVCRMLEREIERRDTLDEIAGLPGASPVE